MFVLAEELKIISHKKKKKFPFLVLQIQSRMDKCVSIEDEIRTKVIFFLSFRKRSGQFYFLLVGHNHFY